MKKSFATQRTTFCFPNFYFSSAPFFVPLAIFRVIFERPKPAKRSGAPPRREHKQDRLARLAPLSYASSMKTITVRLPDALVLQIERESQARRVSKSDVVRERLHQPQRAAVAGGNMSDSIGHILEKSWKAKVPAHPPRFRPPQKRRLAEIIV